MRLTFLGTSAAIPTKERNHTAMALQYEGEILLFDCGEGTQRQMQFAGISPLKISKILISHWHADHFAGLMGLLQTMQLLGRTEPLEVYGPKGAKKIVSTLFKISGTESGYKIKTSEITKSKIFCRSDKYSIASHLLKHSVPTLAFRFQENDKPGKFNVNAAERLGIRKEDFKLLQNGQEVLGVRPEQVLGKPRPGKSIVISCDTLPCDSLVEFAKSADVLVHEATYANDLKEKAEQIGHCTAEDAGRIAKKANVKILFIHHLSARYKEIKQHEREAKKIFKNSRVARDLLEVEI